MSEEKLEPAQSQPSVTASPTADQPPRPATSRRTQLNERRAQIIRVFAEFGFVDLLVQSGLWQHAPAALKARTISPGESEPSSSPARFREALEQLGGAFVKLGQTMSVRPDLVPAEYVAELQKLQDEIPPMPFGTVRRVVEAELGRPLEEAYAAFSTSPLGSASISQVHAANLQDGTEVVVKVQRPEVGALIDLDLTLMTRAAHMLERASWARDMDLEGLVAEFAEAVRSELDFSAEARNLDTFCEFFADNDAVTIPVAHWDYTSSRLLTESRLEGLPLSRPDEIRDSGGDVHRLIRNGVDAYLLMVFELRRFHSDPHPGNLLAMDGDAIGFVDFGRVSTLSERGLDRIADCLIAFAGNDSAGLTDAVLQIARTDSVADRLALRRDLEEMLDRYSTADVSTILAGHSGLSETLEVMRRHRLRVSSQYAMLFQTFGVLEGVVLSLDPDTKLLKVIEPYVQRVVLQRYAPDRMGKLAVTQARQYAHLAERAADALDSVLRHVTAGELGVKVEMDAGEEALDRAEAVANRFSLTLLLSAMAIALALVAGRPMPEWLTYTANALLLVVLVVGAWLFVSIVAAERRSKKRRQRANRR